MYDDDYPTCDTTFASLRVIQGVEPPFTLTSEGKVASRDLRRHLDWLLDQIDADMILQARVKAGKSDVSCFWSSATGHGGPTVDPEQMAKLAEHGLQLWIDFYDSSDGPEV
jgi:hypothetical protein